MSFETTGRLIEVYPVNAVSDKFKKREFVIEQSETRNGYEFREFVKFQLTQDKCSLTDQFKAGDLVKVSFNLRGRRWEKDGNVSYFTNLEAWKLESASGKADENVSPDFPDISQAPFPGIADSGSASEDTDDLPF